MTKRMRLSELRRGVPATITAVGVDPGISDEFVRRLLEMGILEGSAIEVMHEAPFGGDPVAVRVRGALIALRRHEALHIEVEVAHG